MVKTCFIQQTEQYITTTFYSFNLVDSRTLFQMMYGFLVKIILNPFNLSKELRETGHQKKGFKHLFYLLVKELLAKKSRKADLTEVKNY